MRLFMISAALVAAMTGAGAVSAEEPWYKTCKTRPGVAHPILNTCMRESGEVFSVMGTNGCLLSTGNLDDATPAAGSIKGAVTCLATDYARLTFAELWIARFDGRVEPKLQSLPVAVASPLETPGMLKYDRRRGFEFSRRDGLAWSYWTGRQWGLLDSWSFPNAQAGTINGEPYYTVMKFPQKNGQSGHPEAVLRTDAEKSMTDYRASVILGRGFITPVSLDALVAQEGKSEKLHPYNVLRKTVFLHQTEQAALNRGEAARRLDPALYGKAVISRSLFRNGQAPRFLRLGGGGSEVMNLSLARPSEMRVHDDTGLFRLAFLSDIQDMRPPNLFSADPSFSDIALAYRTSAGTILLEVLSDGRVRLHILSQGRDSVSQPPGSPAALAQAAGFTLRPLCERGLNGAALEHCPSGQSGTIFRVSYVTDRTHR